MVGMLEMYFITLIVYILHFDVWEFQVSSTIDEISDHKAEEGNEKENDEGTE
jgi:hypothetical protein